MIYLLPYVYIEFKNTDGSLYCAFQRKKLGSTDCHSQVWKICDGGRKPTWKHTWDFNKHFTRARNARRALDTYLLKKGFYLIGKDEVDRFEKKLKLLL